MGFRLFFLNQGTNLSLYNFKNSVLLFRINSAYNFHRINNRSTFLLSFFFNDYIFLSLYFFTLSLYNFNLFFIYSCDFRRPFANLFLIRGNLINFFLLNSLINTFNSLFLNFNINIFSFLPSKFSFFFKNNFLDLIFFYLKTAFLFFPAVHFSTLYNLQYPFLVLFNNNVIYFNLHYSVKSLKQSESTKDLNFSQKKLRLIFYRCTKLFFKGYFDFFLLDLIKIFLHTSFFFFKKPNLNNWENISLNLLPVTSSNLDKANVDFLSENFSSFGFFRIFFDDFFFCPLMFNVVSMKVQFWDKYFFYFCFQQYFFRYKSTYSNKDYTLFLFNCLLNKSLYHIYKIVNTQEIPGRQFINFISSFFNFFNFPSLLFNRLFLNFFHNYLNIRSFVIFKNPLFFKFRFLTYLPQNYSFSQIISYLNRIEFLNTYNDNEKFNLLLNNPLFIFRNHYINFYQKRIDMRNFFFISLSRFNTLLEFQFKLNFSNLEFFTKSYQKLKKDDRDLFDFREVFNFKKLINLTPTPRATFTPFSTTNFKSDYFSFLEFLDEDFFFFNFLLSRLTFLNPAYLLSFFFSLNLKFKDLLIFCYTIFGRFRQYSKSLFLKIKCDLPFSFLFINSYFTPNFCCLFLKFFLSLKISLWNISLFLFNLSKIYNLSLGAVHQVNFLQPFSFLSSIGTFVMNNSLKSKKFIFQDQLESDNNFFNKLYLDKLLNSKRLLTSLSQLRNNFKSLLFVSDLKSRVIISHNLTNAGLSSYSEKPFVSFSPVLQVFLLNLDKKIKSALSFFFFLHSWVYLGIWRGLPNFQLTSKFSQQFLIKTRQQIINFSSIYSKSPYKFLTSPVTYVSSDFYTVRQFKFFFRNFFFFFNRTASKILYARSRICTKNLNIISHKFPFRQSSIQHINFSLKENLHFKSASNFSFKTFFSKLFLPFLQISTFLKFSHWQAAISQIAHNSLTSQIFGKFRSPIYCFFSSVQTVHNFPFFFFNTFTSSILTFSAFHLLSLLRFISFSKASIFSNLDPRKFFFGTSDYFNLHFSSDLLFPPDQNPADIEKFIFQFSPELFVNAWFPSYYSSADSFFASFFSRGIPFHRNAASFLAYSLVKLNYSPILYNNSNFLLTNKTVTRCGHPISKFRFQKMESFIFLIKRGNYLL